MKRLFIYIALCTFVDLFSQVANSGMSTYDSLEFGKVTVGGYVDAYYGFDFSEPPTSNRPYFVSSNRHHEFNINLAYIDIRYINDKVRATFIPGFGTYMNANYAPEPATLRNLVEANAGIKLSEKRGIWVDAGVLASPFSNESAISKDHLMYTRSFAPEYVPYYLTGVKLSLPLGSKINSYWYLVNGWQTIQDPNQRLSFATQVEYRPTKKVLLNWNNYVGNENSVLSPNFENRYFTDLYLIYNPDGKVSVTSCAYFGRQEMKDTLGLRSAGHWWQANLIGRYRFSKKRSLSARLEYFSDPQSVMVTPVTNETGFSTYSAGLCFDTRITKNAMFRLEHRFFYSARNVYLNSRQASSGMGNLSIANLTVWF
jgi:hypothetical protein